MRNQLACTIATAMLLPASGHAGGFLGADGGKLPLTAGFSDVEGTGGGGLVPWALITGYGSNKSWGANAHYSDVRLRDFDLRTAGIGVGILDRVELSAARQEFEATGTALEGVEVAQDVFGIKVPTDTSLDRCVASVTFADHESHSTTSREFRLSPAGYFDHGGHGFRGEGSGRRQRK